MKIRLSIGSLIIILAFLLLLCLKPIAKTYFVYDYSKYIEEYAKEYNIDPFLVAAVIKTESNFDANAKSQKDAYGLMQLTENTAIWAAGKMEVEYKDNKMLIRPDYNIRMGCWYLSNLSKEFNGDMDLVLAAYNGGRGNVSKWLKDSRYSIDGRTLSYIPFEETDIYVKRVNINHKIYKFLYEN